MVGYPFLAIRISLPANIYLDDSSVISIMLFIMSNLAMLLLENETPETVLIRLSEFSHYTTSQRSPWSSDSTLDPESMPVFRGSAESSEGIKITRSSVPSFQLYITHIKHHPYRRSKPYTMALKGSNEICCRRQCCWEHIS